MKESSYFTLKPDFFIFYGVGMKIATILILALRAINY